MIKAVSKRDFKKYGCVSCGCDCVKLDNQWSMSSAFVVCAECGAEFMILDNKLTKSDICRASDIVNERGERFMEYPMLIEHPRKGIKKHQYVAEDKRPDVKDGDYMECQSMYYNRATFKVNGIEAAKRIGQLFANASNSTFKYHINYNKKYPLNLNVVIESDDIERLSFLVNIIKSKGGIITPLIISRACYMIKDFYHNWTYGNNRKCLTDIVNQKYLNDLFHNETHELNQDESKNPLLMCEALGVKTIIDDLLINNNSFYAENVLASFIESIDSPYYHSTFENSVFSQKLLELASGRAKKSLVQIPAPNKREIKLDTTVDAHNVMLSYRELLHALEAYINISSVQTANDSLYQCKVLSVNIVNYLLTGLYYQIKSDIVLNNFEDMAQAINHVFNALTITYRQYYSYNGQITDILTRMRTIIAQNNNHQSYTLKKGV